MKNLKKLIKIWNKNFDKGVSVFQMVLGFFMFLGAFTNNQFLVLFSMFNFLFAYFEPTNLRFSI